MDDYELRATGHKFSIGVATIPDGELVGVAICGRPVARALDNGRTIEVSHVYEAVEAPFDARDPKWKRCLEGCRPAAGMHRTDCPNRRELQVLRAMAGMVAGRLARMAP